MNGLSNLSGLGTSLQVGRLMDIPVGDYESGEYFLIKNITDNNIIASIKPAGQVDYVSTVLYPGWNPELVKGVKGVVVNTLQAGI